MFLSPGNMERIILEPGIYLKFSYSSFSRVFISHQNNFLINLCHGMYWMEGRVYREYNNTHFDQGKNK